MSDNRTLNQVKEELKNITMDDVYKTIGKWVIWSFLMRTTIKVISR